MKRALRLVAVAATLLGASTSADAGPILELESNNSIAAAQAIPSSAFTLPVPPTVFNPPGYATATVTGAGGGNDVDFYGFTANGGNVYFDIDDNPFTFDTIVSLFDSSGTLLAFNDDSFPEDPGTGFGQDSFLGVFTLPGPGTFYVAVSAFPPATGGNFPNQAITGTLSSVLSRPDGGAGGYVVGGVTPGDSSYAFGPVTTSGTAPYTLHISVQSPTLQTTPVPEPATMLLFGAGLSAIGARLRRRR